MKGTGCLFASLISRRHNLKRKQKWSTHMNRFLIEHHPAAIAKSLCDKHIVKMPLEEAQMLSFAVKRYVPDIQGLQGGPKAHAKHPCTTWAGDTRGNYMYG